MKKILIAILLLSPFSSLAQWVGTNPVYVSTGNVGIGNSGPQNRLAFPDMPFTTNPDGITWYGADPYSYGIYRTAGSWTSPSYQQLRINWGTGIILHPGAGWTYSYVDVRGDGLRVTSGTVGIGTTTPSAKLHVVGSGAGNVDAIVNGRIQTGDGGGVGGIWLNSAQSLFVGQFNTTNIGFYNNGQWPMVIDNSGRVGIGSLNPSQKLTVNGTIYGKEVKVDLSVPGPDYVFEKSYALPTLDEVRSYIDENKHLPEIPTAKDMEANGIKLGEMNMLLLKKVEELTLYVLELKTQNDEQQKQINTLLKH